MIKRVIRDQLIILEINITIGVKEMVENIIKQGISVSAKYSFKQVVKE